MSESSAELHGASFRRHWLALAAIVVGHAVLSAICNPFVARSSNQPDWIEMLTVGLMFSQPFLFGTWAALGPPPAMKRVPLSAASLVLVELASAIASVGDYEPELFAITFSLFGTSILLMLIVRKTARWQIGTERDAGRGATAVNQFSLKYLLILTTVCASLLGVARVLVSMSTLQRSPVWQPDLAELLVPIGLVTLAIFPAVLVPLVALFPRPTMKILITVPCLWLALAWLAVEAVVALGNETRVDVIRDIALLQLSAMTSGLLSTLVLRVAGYRLLRRAPAAAGINPAAR
jgi:hypothetical protein